MDEENEPEGEGSESVVDESVSEEKGKEDYTTRSKNAEKS